MIRLRRIKWKKCYRRAAYREWLDAHGAKVTPCSAPYRMGPADTWVISW